MSKIDLLAFLRTLRGERQPTCLIHGQPLSGKSQFAQELAEQTGWSYLDVLGTLGSQPERAARIDQFQLDDLRDLILATVEADVLLIDDLDFLFPIWVNDVHPFQEFVRTLKHRNRQVAFCFFAHTRRDFEEWTLWTASRASRVLRFDDIRSLI